jgi:nucleoside-diphosphate-sugar epimerase
VRRVLVTGASGFIGRHTLPLLVERGFEVHAVSRSALASLPDGVHTHSANLLDSQQAMELVRKVQPTHLLHLAWEAVPGRFWHSEENFQWVASTLALIREFANHSGQRFVGAGTCAEYDWSFGICNEKSTPLSPQSVYGLSKRTTFELCQSFAELRRLEFVWGRVFLLYGPHERPERLVSSVILSLLKGVEARCSHGEQIRDFLHIEDAAGAFVALLDSSIEGAVNIGSGTPVSIRETVTLIADALGMHDRVRFGAIPPPANDPPILLPDLERIRSEIGWEPSMTLAEGVQQTVAWWSQSPPGESAK